jgi:enoyl-CoA hydratase/carnithine racemase
MDLLWEVRFCILLQGGFELALGADLRIAGENAKVGLPETGLAIIPG